MDQPITENHKEIRNEHASLKEASATEVNAADSPVEVGQGDSAQVNPPSAPSVIVGSSKTSDVQPKGKHNLIAVTQHVNNEPCESVPIAKSISGPGGIASSAVERGADNVVSEDVPAKKCNENVPSSGTLPDNSSRQLGRSAPSASVPSGENGHARGRTNNDALSSKVTIVKESQSYSSIPNLTNDSSEKVTPAPTKGIEPSSDRSKVALEEKQRTEASPSTNTSQECDALMTTNTKEANSKNKVALPSQPEKLKINSSEENENKIPACDIERAENSIDSVSEAEENALTTGTKYVADHQKESGEGMSVHEDSASNSPHTSRGANEGSKSRASEDESLRSHTEKPKGRCSLRVDESRVNLSDNGDDDQEMEEFEHVASKATDGDKDLGEPMSVDIADASVEESMEMNTADEDPFGLANESETKLDDCEEPMEVDDTSDKDKTQDVPESDEIAPVLSGDKESDSIASERLEGGKLPSDADKESSSKVANLEAKAAQPIEVVAEDESNTEPASVNSIGTSGDQTSEEPKDGDEEICIIPDTFRTLSDQTVADGQLSSKDRTEKDDESDSTRDGKAKLDKDKSKEDKSKSSVGRSPGRRDKTSTSIDGDKKTEYTGRPQRLAAKRAVSQIKELAKEDSNSGDSVGKYQADDIKEIASSPQMCYQCCRVTACKYEVLIGGQERYLCQEPCYNLFLNERDRSDESPVSETQIANTDEDFLRKCGQCATVVTGDEKNLAWETMDFCNEECLGKYQTQLGSYCANCKGPTAPASLGKYCVRFGYDIKQFCCSSCLEEFKKGLKVCSYCQKDISSGTEGFLAPVGDKGQFKDFCRQKCMEKYDNMSNNVAPPMVSHECAVCNNEKVVQYQFILKSKIHKLCSEPCFAAFKFVNNVKEDQCDMCKKYFDKVHTEVFTVYYDDTPHSFCCKTCMNVYILANRKIVPCNWCKVKKYNFDMIKRVVGSGQVIMMCSLNCLTLYQVSVSAVSSKRIKCDMCSGVAQAQYHLTMSDATIRNFCSYQCVMSFQGQYGKTPPLTITGGGDKTAIPTSAGTTGTPIPTGGPKRVYPTRRSVTQTTQNEALPTAANSLGPVISSVQSLAPNTQVSSPTTRSQAHKLPPQANSVSGKQPVLYKQQLVVKPPPPKVMRNKAVFCRPLTVNKGVSCRPHGCSKETQTDDNMGKPVLIPIPVPIYVPAPMHMYCSPFPVPVPFPLPIPVPMFIPTTRHSAQGILREIKRIQEKIPTDPFEAELLMMAEMVADDKKPADSDSESEAGENDAGDVSEVQGAASAAEGGFSPEAVDTSNFGEDMLQMALKMASELDEPAVDLEAALTPSTITAQSNTSIEHNDGHSQ